MERWKDAHTSLDLELLDKPIGRALGWRVIESHQTCLSLSVCSLAWLGVSGIIGSSPLHIQGSQVADFAIFLRLAWQWEQHARPSSPWLCCPTRALPYLTYYRLCLATEKALHALRQRVSNLSIHQSPWQTCSNGVPAGPHPWGFSWWTPDQFPGAASAGLQCGIKPLPPSNQNTITPVRERYWFVVTKGLHCTNQILRLSSNS